MLNASFLRKFSDDVRKYAVGIEGISIEIPNAYTEELKNILSEAITDASKGYKELRFTRRICEDFTIAELVRLGFKLSRTRFPNHFEISW